MITCSISFSQKARKWDEVGILLGGSYYLGDLNKVHFKNTQPAGGILFRKNLSSLLALRLSGLYGTVKASDAQSNSAAQQYRNLSFESSIMEVSGQIEFNYYEIDTEDPDRSVSPYLFTGLSYFRMNPKALYNGGDIYLIGLHTEGQGSDAYPDRKPYKVSQISIPLGIGLKMYPTKRLGIHLEWGIRRTFTDYLDDVSTTYVDPAVLPNSSGGYSAYFADQTPVPDDAKFLNIGRQRGNSENKDWYSFFGLSLSVNISKGRIICPH